MEYMWSGFEVDRMNLVARLRNRRTLGMFRFRLRTVGPLLTLLAVADFVVGSHTLQATAQARQSDAALIAQREATEKELESIAVIDRKVMVPMRDGKRMQADVYRPKDESKKYPIIFVRTPYNFNFWEVDPGAPRDMKSVIDAVKRGYAYVEMNERGRYFSEVITRS